VPVINLADYDFGFTPPSSFDEAGAAEPLQITVSGTQTVTITGGVLLGSETNLPHGDSVVYGTASPDANDPDLQPDPSLQQSITITFTQPISTFSVKLFNGDTDWDTFQISDNTGHVTTVTLASSDSVDGVQTVSVPNTHGATSITITSLTNPWDFSIDNIAFQPVTPIIVTTTPNPDYETVSINDFVNTQTFSDTGNSAMSRRMLKKEGRRCSP
jgi:hypothetical protein